MAISFLPVAATGLLGFLSGLFGPPKPVHVPEKEKPRTVSSQIVVSAATGIRGTMLMLHGGGWTGPDREAQEHLVEQPGDMLVKRGWRVVSVDYHPGKDGLQDILNAAGEELKAPTGGLLCIYGESSGGHLALLAAAKLRAVDCVIAAGTPTDFAAYQAEAAASGDHRRGLVAKAIADHFGTDPAETAPWQPVVMAPAIGADVLMVHESDDTLVPVQQIDNFVSRRPTTQRADLEAADQNDPGAWWLHGTLSEAGRNQYMSAIGAFVDRVADAHLAERYALRTRCGGVTRLIGQVGAAVVQRSLRCLVQRDAEARQAGVARATTFTRRARGELNAARAWALLRRSVNGRRALAALARDRAKAVVRLGNPSEITLRVKRRAVTARP